MFPFFIFPIFSIFILIIKPMCISYFFFFLMPFDPSIHAGRRPPSGVCPPPGSHTRHAPLWCLARLPALISLPHPPQVTILTCPPLPIPSPTSRPQQPTPQPLPPTRPNMPSVICPANPPLTSPAMPHISIPPYAPPVQLLTWLTLCPSASKPLPRGVHQLV